MSVSESNLSEEQERELKNVAENLIGTLVKDVSSTEADEIVAEQIERIYRILGYNVQTFVSDTANNTRLRVFLKKDAA